MKLSLDISFYPLTKDYETPILKFISTLKQCSDLRVVTNDLSTHVFGDSAIVFPKLQEATEQSFSELEQASVVVKILKGDLQGQWKP